MFAVLLACGVAWLFGTQRNARLDLEAAYAETDLLDPGWRIDDLMKQRRHVADADNSALLIDAAKRAGMFGPGHAPNYDTTMDGWKAPLPLSFTQRDFLRVEFAKMPKALALMRQLKDRPYGSFAIVLNPEFVKTLLPHLDGARSGMDCLFHDALLRVHDESATASLESCRALLNAGRSLSDEPFMIVHLSCYLAHYYLVAALEYCLSQGEATPESLAALQADVARELGECDWRFALRGERAGGLRLLETMDESVLKFRDLKQAAGWGRTSQPSRWREFALDYLPLAVKEQIPQYLRNMNRIVEAAKLPLHEQVAAMAAIEADLPNQPYVAQVLTPNVRQMVNAHRRFHALLRSALVALACERYRMQHAAWPDALDQLVAAKLLDAVPLDPFDGKPLRFRRTEWGIVVYAIGTDEVDDGGVIDRDGIEGSGTDLGFRLWDVPRHKGGAP